MTDSNDLERLIASMASGERVDWTAARALAASEDVQARIDALQGIEQIAAFSHAQWERFEPLLERALGMKSADLEAWLAGLDTRDAADVRRALSARTTPGSASTDSAPSFVEPLAGHVIGPYTLEAPIGEGGMGTVWLARRSDGRFEARVAVKLLHLPRVGRDGLARFQREGHILARMHHPNIAQLLDAGVTASGQPYLVLEHVDGMAIDRYCDSKRLSTRERIALFLEVLDAVAHAQTNLVLHRDLKPSNILVDQSGHVKLLDFGVAKLLEGDGDAGMETELTQRAGRAFTPEYAAPEQLKGEAVTTATDVYGAGVVLYFLLTGMHPTGRFGSSPVERIEAILQSTPKLASDAVTGATRPKAPAPLQDSRQSARLRRDLLGDLDNILAKALKKSPPERYPNAAGFAEDLRRYLNQEPVLARPDTITYRVGKFVRRHRGAVASATLAIVALMAVTTVAITQLFEARHQRDEAVAQTQRAEAFNTVVTSLLSQTGHDGRALRPEELLDRAVVELEARYANDPAFLVDMLIRISGRYLDLSNHVKELSTLVKAEEIARRTGDTSLIYDVQVNTVETELFLGHKPEARKRMEEARRLLPDVRPAPSMHNYLRAEAELAKAEGDIPRALDYLERGRREMEAADNIHGNSYHGLLSVLRLYYWYAGDNLKAYACAQRMVEINKMHQREETVSGKTARMILANSIYSLGQVVRSRQSFLEALPEVEPWDSERSKEWKNMGTSYGEILSRLGEVDKAVPIIRDAIDVVSHGGNRMGLIRGHATLSRAYLRGGRVDEAETTLAALLAEIARDETAYGVYRLEAIRQRAEIELARGHLDRAAEDLNAELHRIGYPEMKRALGLPEALLTLARVQHAQHRLTEAQTSARAALQIFESDTLDPTQSANVGEALLELAQIQRVAGDTAAASASLQRATPALRNGLGADHALTRQSERLAGLP